MAFDYIAQSFLNYHVTCYMAFKTSTKLFKSLSNTSSHSKVDNDCETIAVPAVVTPVCIKTVHWTLTSTSTS